MTKLKDIPGTVYTEYAQAVDTRAHPDVFILNTGCMAYHLSSLAEAKKVIADMKAWQKENGIGGYTYRVRARGPRVIHLGDETVPWKRRSLDQDLPLALGNTFSVYRSVNYDFFRARGIRL